MVTHYIGSSEGEMNQVDDIKNCLLYKWFKEKCEEYQVHVPDDTIDHPVLHPSSYRLSTCLSLGAFGSDTNWRYRVKTMPYADKLNRLYPILHFMCYIRENEEDKIPF